MAMTIPTRSTPKQILGLIAWLALAFATAAIGAAASVNAGPFYGDLDRPGWAPPGWVFGPVWSVLYALMGVAAWMVWRRGGFAAHRTALVLFLVQLVANGLWSWLFFAWRLGALSFMDIVLLWGLILLTMIAFWRISRPAAVLLVPYLLWVSYAAALNFAIWRMNPQILG